MEYSKLFSILLVRIFFSFFLWNFFGLKFQCFLKIIEFMSKLSKVPQNSYTLHSLVPIWHLLSFRRLWCYFVKKVCKWVVVLVYSLGGQLFFLGCTTFWGWAYPTMNLDQHVSRWSNLSLNQCWAVLTFLRTGWIRFFHDFMRTWLVLIYIYIYIFIYIWADENR